MNDMTISGKSALDSFLDQKMNGLEGSVKSGSTATNKNLTEAERAGMQKAARGFEAIFFGMLFKEMKETKIDQKSEDDGFGADVLDGYTNMAFADQVSNTGSGIGIAQMIYKQMTGEDLPSKTVIDPGSGSVPLSSLMPEITPNAALSTKKSNLAASSSQLSMSATLSDKVSRWDDLISSASAKFGIDPSIVKAVVAAESAGNPNAVSSAGAKGLMQLMDSTAADVGVTNSFNPADNINGGASYLKQMLDKFDGNLDHALAAYNAGPGNVDKYGGVPPFDETRSYVNKVKKYINYYK